MGLMLPSKPLTCQLITQSTLLRRLLFLCRSLYLIVTFIRPVSYTCRKLRHPNIITLMAYSINEHELHIVTNFVEGKTLDKLIFGKDSEEVINGICTQLLVNYHKDFILIHYRSQCMLFIS